MSFGKEFWQWENRLPSAPHLAINARSRLTLGEGGTPLVKSRRIGPRAGIDNLYFKLETANPSGSYKDRFAAAAISALLARGNSRCLATSSGNTGAALATYCAAAGIECTIAILETTPTGKLLQMLAHGARLLRVHGFGVDPTVTQATFEMLAQIGRAEGNPPEISAYHYSPIGMSGVQTISYELAEQFAACSSQLDHVFVPAGGGGLALAVALGFELLEKSGQPMPRIEAVQPEGNDTIASPLREGLEHARAVDCTSSISGLQVPSVIDGDAVIAHCRSAGGTGHVVTDESIWQTQQRLALEEGVFCEPAGAVALAGALKALTAGEIDPRASIVCLVTGSAFKDTPSVERMTQSIPVPTVDINELTSLLQQP